MIGFMQDIRDSVGYEIGLSSWITITREMIEGFARLTGNAPLGEPPAQRNGPQVAQGQLILSLLPRMLLGELTRPGEDETPISYGFDRVRFVTPVTEGAQVRGRFALMRCEETAPGTTRLHWQVTVEIRGSRTPALVADWITMRLPRSELPRLLSAA
ncbi:hotdog family protein [Jhaorihella thermophila]|uniref:Acyl dehydratase n=1 Tax=Jhaorihella thermophila TaxID=488547 RepID=A0A1H5X241_9RHOB|nr:Nodulation protein N [Jhaorihella thermophila]SEG05430.1 Acyl dehydratase [Jhaorihella thermophila]